MEVSKLYSGPHLSFPLTVTGAAELVEAFRNKQVGISIHSDLFGGGRDMGPLMSTMM